MVINYYNYHCYYYYYYYCVCVQLYHEAVIINLLETAMYHSDACEAADDAITDLIDYLHRKLTYLTSRSAYYS